MECVTVVFLHNSSSKSRFPIYHRIRDEDGGYFILQVNHLQPPAALRVKRVTDADYQARRSK
jgi:hypothetical protein|eukprot:scaffold1131_cov278-Chaetoceros_neogracile.AAC.6